MVADAKRKKVAPPKDPKAAKPPGGAKRRDNSPAVKSKTETSNGSKGASFPAFLKRKKKI